CRQRSPSAACRVPGTLTWAGGWPMLALASMRENTFERGVLEDVNAITGFGPAVVPARTAGPPGRVVRDLGRPVVDRPAGSEGPPAPGRRQRSGRAGRLRRDRRLGSAPRQ